MDPVTLAIGFAVGAGIGILFARVYWRQKDSIPSSVHSELQRSETAAQERVRSLEAERTALNETVSKTREQVMDLTRKLSGLEARQPQLEQSQRETKAERDRYQSLSETQVKSISSQNAMISTLETEKKLLEQQLETLKNNFEEMKQQTKSEFEILANEILKAKTKDFTEQTEQRLGEILKPLKEKIESFGKSVDEKYTTEAKERHALKSEIERLIGLNDQMTKETHSLTQALRGDSKVQGDWGELVLEKILEASGLREGHEYSQQESLKNEEGQTMRPDIIINLPDGKHVIVDSKVSLTGYEHYRRTEDDAVRKKALAAHLESLDRHVNDLSSKHYARLKGVNSPELVFLFVPIEPAYVIAMQTDSDLSTKAWKKGVAIVTATTLLTSLKTVAHIWRLENQNKNALEIANEGAKLYDKFVGFVEDFEKIGNTLRSGQTQYESAMGKLKDGPGNVFRKIERLRELGAAPTKQIKKELLD